MGFGFSCDSCWRRRHLRGLLSGHAPGCWGERFIAGPLRVQSIDSRVFLTLMLCEVVANAYVQETCEEKQHIAMEMGFVLTVGANCVVDFSGAWF